MGRLPERFGSASTVHRTVYRWDSKGVFDRLWALLIYHCEALQAVHWEWQAADGCMNKARFVGKRGAKADRARHRKAGPSKTGPSRPGPSKPGPSKTGPSKTRPTAEGSGVTPPTASKLGVKQSLLVEERGGPRFLSASRGPT